MNISELFWNSSVEEIKKGYIFDKEKSCYICLLCGNQFEKGVIYPNLDFTAFYDAEKWIQLHICQAHGSTFEYLINMNKKYTGLTDHQKTLLLLFKEGFSDKELVEKLAPTSSSTIRNHRFKLKEREKQSKIFLAIMELLETKDSKTKKENSSLITIHKGATMIDERYAITKEEQEKVLKNYFKEKENGKLTSFPTKEKRKIIVLQEIVKQFEIGRVYSEKEVNQILQQLHDDFATLRRYLIEYGFMERSDDCRCYKVKS